MISTRRRQASRRNPRAPATACEAARPPRHGTGSARRWAASPDRAYRLPALPRRPQWIFRPATASWRVPRALPADLDRRPAKPWSRREECRRESAQYSPCRVLPGERREDRPPRRSCRLGRRTRNGSGPQRSASDADRPPSSPHLEREVRSSKSISRHSPDGGRLDR